MSVPLPSPPPPPTSPDSGTTPSTFARIMRTTLSYDTNVMLAAIISLLLVILFVLFLHLYTRWFLLQARRRSRTSVTVPRVIGSRLHQRLTIIDASISDHSSGKFGLPFSTIASIPLFIYKTCSNLDRDSMLECAICLSVFEDDEIGRKLPACGHAFHVECIDMWLHSHATCPVCRAAIRCNRNHKTGRLEAEITDLEPIDGGLELELRLEIVTATSNRIDEHHESVDVDYESGIGTSSSSSIEESQLPGKLLTNTCSCSSRSGGKIYPSSIVNGDESEA
ncbi:hypothetical protein E3N88_18577 [Mikania micrantha]|uniref:RING-type E3 ubiquitin transferase n=1 Tax=Mikania micrantha TaxID=192012 RepID=A0A5N6NKS8_9ASTR|nr:hypothetical protein E3N88_18577 [Mikania micrantha]